MFFRKPVGHTTIKAGLLLLGLLILAAPQDASASMPRKRILILFPFSSHNPGFIKFESGFRSTLISAKDYEFEFYVECMDLDRFSSKSYHDGLMKLYHEKYAGSKIDLIVAVQLMTWDFLTKYRPESFLEVPVMLYSQDAGLAGNRVTTPNVTTVLGRLDMSATLALAMRLHPDVRKVFVVTGGSRFDQLLEGIARRDFRDFERQIEFHYLSGLPLDELIERVSSLPQNSLLFYLSIFQDGNGKTFNSPDALALISARANAPIYSVSETYIGSGIIGGRVIDHAVQGAMVAREARRILTGEKTESMWTTKESGNRYIFDARRLKRWGIEEARLPADSEVRYREFSPWAEYRWRLVAIVTILTIQALLITALFVSRRRQLRGDRALREAELKYRTVADSAYDWEYWSAADGRLLYISPSCERITGYSNQEFFDNPALIREIVVPQDLESRDGHGHEGPLNRVSRSTQFRIRTRAGDVRWIEHACRPVFDEKGEFQGTRASNRDITERKKALAEAQSRREELAHVTRIVTVGELATALAHEINQPLTAIRCNAEAARRFLKGTAPDLEEVARILDDIIQDGARAGEVIRRLRFLAKKHVRHHENVNLNEIILETAGLIRSASLLDGLSIKTELDCNPASVQGDRVQLQQVVLNLLMNATTAMRDTPVGARKLVLRTAMKDSRAAIVAVIDAGPGIDENHMDRLFEPFFTTKEEGLGMGLAISRTIIEIHGGTITAANNPEGGAGFYFTLPVEPKRQP